MHLPKMRRVRRYFLGAAVLPALLCGCESMNNTERGAIGGGLIGGLFGTVIGAATHHPGIGAAVGAGAGALGGAAIGNSMDRREERQNAEALAYAQASSHGPVSIQDIAQMALNHLSDEVIINQVRTSGTVYNLNPNDLVYLKQNGVSDAVIEEMQATRYRPVRRVYVTTPVYEPYYAPPPVVGVGFVGRIR